MNEQKVTSIQELQEYQKGQFVQLPDFAEGMPFYARLKRPSLLMLAKSGQIPNSLLLTANKLFNGKNMEEDNKNALKDTLDVLESICKATFIEPSYKAMKDAGIELTDEQMIAVFNYTQNGVKSLEPFRSKSTSDVINSNVTNV